MSSLMNCRHCNKDIGYQTDHDCFFFCNQECKNEYNIALKDRLIKTQEIHENYQERIEKKKRKKNDDND